ncbi:MAG: CRISPR-associated endonuclease Cas1 [Selenomonadaceae bacterium]|nr:CRISPR-associated endonuclease Cas1 [Selenomonadaceae bacterium]
MSILYISDPDTRLGFEANRVVATYADGTRHTLPAETVESITFLTRAHISTYCMEECLKRGIPVAFFSKGGRYYGRLVSTVHANAALQRQQSRLYDTDFSIELARRIIAAKVRNQMTVARRYARARSAKMDDAEGELLRYLTKIPTLDTIEEIMGYEGQSAKVYFAALSKLIDPAFAFRGRSRRPPRDPFNSLISLGYSILMNEIYNEIENKGLNPYFGFIHRDAERHPTLASDLLEEWRAVLIDSTAMSLLNGHELSESHFRLGDDEHPGCFLTRDGFKIYIKKLEQKLKARAKYLRYIDNAVTFRRAIALQIGKLAEAIREEDASGYEPIVIR